MEDRYLIGRGVQDNKMTAIGVFHVMNCLRELGVPMKHRYTLYMGTSEETGMEDVRYFVRIIPARSCPWCRMRASLCAVRSGAARASA